MFASLKNLLNGSMKSLRRHSNAPLRTRSSCRPAFEALEDRCVPTIAYVPHFGPEALQPPASGTGYTVMSSATVNLIFWGQYWNTPTGQAQANTFANDAQTIVASPYLSGLKQYGSDGHATIVGRWTDASSDPVWPIYIPPSYVPQTTNAGDPKSASAIQTEIQKAILDPTSRIYGPAYGSSLTAAPIYVVITDPSHAGSNGGYNVSGVFGSSPINMISVGTDGSETSFGLAFSHELAERMSDPTGNNAGVTVMPPAGIPSSLNGGLSQIGDNEPEPSGQPHYSATLSGVTVQAYWSNLDQAFIVPDGTSAMTYRYANWSGSTYLNTYVQSTFVNNMFAGTLLPGQTLSSPNGQYRLTLQTSGNLAEFNAGGSLIWQTGTAGLGVTQMVMQPDGNLVVYSGSKAVWSSGTWTHHAAFLSVRNDGNLEISQGTTPIWTTGTAQQTALTVGQHTFSPNGQYYLVLQGDGNLVEYNSQGNALWSTGTWGQTGVSAVMQSDGNLVLYKGGAAIWSSGTWNHPGAFLSVQDDGNVVIYQGNTALWASNTAQPGFLNPGQAIFSPNGQYYLTLQSDGNLVEYNLAGKALWSTGTWGQSVSEAIMQADGNFVLYGPNHTAVWSSGTWGHPGAFLMVQNDGNITIDVIPTWFLPPKVLWASNTVQP
jgi:hypothetical protein